MHLICCVEYDGYWYTFISSGTSYISSTPFRKLRLAYQSDHIYGIYHEIRICYLSSVEICGQRGKGIRTTESNPPPTYTRGYVSNSLYFFANDYIMKGGLGKPSQQNVVKIRDGRRILPYILDLKKLN